MILVIALTLVCIALIGGAVVRKISKSPLWLDESTRWSGRDY